MRFRVYFIVIAFPLFFIGTGKAQGVTQKTTAEIVAGRFVATPETPATVWYVHPGLKTRQQVSSWETIQNAASRSTVVLPTKTFTEIANDVTGMKFDQKFVSRLRGNILLDVSTGLQWYVSPRDGKRYPLRAPAQALPMLHAAKLGISQKNVDKIPTADQTSAGDLKLRKRLRGNVLFNVADATYWYVSPKNLKRYPLQTEADAAAILKTQFRGVTAVNLAKLPQFTDSLVPKKKTLQQYSGFFVQPSLDSSQLWYVSPKKKIRELVTPANAASITQTETVVITSRGLTEIRLTGEADYTETTVTTELGTFTVKLLTSDLSLSGLRILTLGANSDTCIDACATLSVGQFASLYSGIVAVNGGYFCPGNTASCEDTRDSYYGPLYHSISGIVINDDQLLTSPYPMLVFDTNNTAHYLRQALQFGSVQQFQTTYGVTIQAGIANWPVLIERGVNVVGSQLLDSGQKNTKTTRVAFGVKGKTVYFLVVAKATVTDLASVVATYGLDYAINLDGGSSTALWQYGEYKAGPGRTVPNAIVIGRVP